MKLVKILIIIIFFYFLTLFQTSFLAHFNIWGLTINIVLISIIVFNIFEKSENYFGLLAAGMGGLFLDIFSSRLIGLNILILLGVAIFIKLILKSYVRIPIIERT